MPQSVAVHDRDRSAPVALPRDEPVAQAVVDRRVPLALAVEPRDDRAERLAIAHPVEVGVRADEHAVAGVRQIVLPGALVGARGGSDHAPDRQPEGLREGMVALVVSGHGHDRAGAILHEHVVGDVHRDLLAVDGVGDGLPQRHAGLRALGVAALLARLGERVVDVLAHRVLVRGACGEAHDVGVLGGHHEEGRAEQRVGAGGEDGVVDAELLAAEGHLGALAAPDPVALHRLHVLGPVDPVEVAEQPLGVVGDAQEPLLELPDFDERAAALAVAVGVDLLVGEHGLVFGAPLDGGLLAVGEAARGTARGRSTASSGSRTVRGGELARPVDRDAPRVELALEGGDRLGGRLARVHAGLDRVVLGGQPERVIAHRVQHARAEAAVEMRDRVADRVALQVADVRLAARVGEHLQHVGAGCPPTLLRGAASTPPAVLASAGGALVGHLPGALLGPHGLPARLDLVRVVSVLCHRESQVSGPTRTAPRLPAARFSGTRGQLGEAAPVAQQLDDLGGRLGGRAGVERGLRVVLDAQLDRLRRPASPAMLRGQRERHVDAGRDAGGGHDACRRRPRALRPARPPWRRAARAAEPVDWSRACRRAARRRRGSASRCTPTSSTCSSRVGRAQPVEHGAVRRARRPRRGRRGRARCRGAAARSSGRSASSAEHAVVGAHGPAARRRRT